MASSVAEAQKLADTYAFIPADLFFRDLDRPGSGVQRPIAVTGFKRLPGPHNISITFDDSSELEIFFVKPKLWRLFIRTKDEDAKDSGTLSHNVVQSTHSRLVEVLSGADEKSWNTEIIDDDRYIIFQSFFEKDSKQIITKLWLQKNPFKMSVTQPCEPIRGWGSMSLGSQPTEASNTSGTMEKQNLVVWETTECPLLKQDLANVMTVAKPNSVGCLGFGEQGGDSLLQDHTYINFFNYDNMLYEGVYGNGPLDPREPLYHSEPFWMEVNRRPGYHTVIGTFVDSYSHVALDVGKVQDDQLRIATRFGNADIYIMAGETVREVVEMYTSLVGRPWLKPRYALGYGQGAYGYDSRRKLESCVTQYRQCDFPIDTLHIDVDLQDRYCTFTVDEEKFPEPNQMFRLLKDQGIKCSTNITPIINADVSYRVQQELLQKKFYVSDRRLLRGNSSLATYQRYMCYEGGKIVLSDPNFDRPGFGDDYDFAEAFNTGGPYHGGVNYGVTRGAAGYYPDLNRQEVRDWWGEQYRYLFGLGLSFVWQDMTSPSISKEYGDMKSFPARLLLSDDQKDGRQRAAIEIWSLYALNLHKATFKGLNNLPTQQGKRNYIIGRGSFAGMHRYAGLWTGDNGSSWDFLRISITQAISLGLSGLVVSGGDVGGFMGLQGQKYVSPDLLMRWYSAAFLLPWFRNHYNGKPGQKLFQEPFRYWSYYQEHRDEIGEDEEHLYKAVLPVTRYYTKLRYSLLQMLYDGLFENIFTGLPIVQGLILSDQLDETLLTANRSYLSNEYIVRKDLLVAPILKSEQSAKGWRSVYLPGPDSWFKFNLQATEPLGKRLSPQISGGSLLNIAARLGEKSIEDITPMFVREGAIIPKQAPRGHIADPNTDDTPPSPITMHVYPGKDNQYDMYLDDGVSRASAPKSSFLDGSDASVSGVPTALVADPEAASKYRHVRIATSHPQGMPGRRCITVSTVWDGYGSANVVRDIGKIYTVVLWQETAETVMEHIQVTGTASFEIQRDESSQAIIVLIPVDADEPGQNIEIQQIPLQR